MARGTFETVSTRVKAAAAAAAAAAQAVWGVSVRVDVHANNVSASALPMKKASSTSLLSLSSSTTPVVLLLLLLFSSVVARHLTSAAVRRWLRYEARAVAGAEVDS